MYPQFGLVLMVTHACNLRCSYCYTGDKFRRTIPDRLGQKSIDRALASISPGGTLELGFFGGEPLLEAALVARLIDHARQRASAGGKSVSVSLTTNGTITDGDAWSVMTDPDVQLAISCDGLPEVHDRHRPDCGGGGSAERVISTMRRLMAAGKEIRVAIVVRPDTVDVLPESVEFLFGLGAIRLEPSIDVWSVWGDEAIAGLQRAVARCARIWRDGLPDRSIGWFDEKAAQLANLPAPPTARCGFGHGEIAVAPSGRLFPCERLIGDDGEDNPMALPGHAADGVDFLDHGMAPERSDKACDACVLLSMCNTICRCSNYVRTGDVRRPDRLLCAWNQACLTETARVLDELAPPSAIVPV